MTPLKDSNQLDILDILSILSFIIGTENLKYNITQDDIQRVMQKTDDQTSRLLAEIHERLQEQDSKLDYILEKLKTVEGAGDS